MSRLSGLSEQDVMLVQRALDQLRGMRANPQRGRYSPPEEAHSPDVYVAVAPAGGIAAASEHPGTGSGSSVADVSSAECKIYDVRPYGGGNRVVPMRFTQRVYNLLPTAIAEGDLFLAVRDKGGSWIATQPAPVASGSSSAFTPTEVNGTVLKSNLDYDAINGDGTDFWTFTFPSAGTYHLTGLMSFDVGTPIGTPAYWYVTPKTNYTGSVGLVTYDVAFLGLVAQGNVSGSAIVYTYATYYLNLFAKVYTAGSTLDFYFSGTCPSGSYLTYHFPLPPRAMRISDQAE